MVDTGGLPRYYALQDTPLDVTPEQWLDLFDRYHAGEDVGPEMIDSSVIDPMVRGDLWLGQRFQRLPEAEQQPMIARVAEHLASSPSPDSLLRLLRLAGWMGSTSLRDAVRTHFERTENDWIKKNALFALVRIEEAATERGEARLPAVYQFWNQIMGNPDREIATWGFEGLRNSDLVRAVGSLDRFFGTGKPPDRIARTLRGMRRDAIRQSIDIGPALKDFLRAHPDLSEAHLGMMREAFGEALMSAI